MKVLKALSILFFLHSFLPFSTKNADSEKKLQRLKK
jgi:hypothetical protein